jgi:hypothetical protein
MMTPTNRAGGDAGTRQSMPGADVPVDLPVDVLVSGAQVAGRFRLNRLLVRRPHAPYVQVWSAVDLHSGRDVDLTVLLEEATDPFVRQAFAQRAQALLALRDPAAIRVGGHGRAAVVAPAGSAAVSYVVSEPAPGVPLTEVPTGGRGGLGIARTLDLIAQAARGLEAAHALGIVHGGIRRSSLHVARHHRLTVVNFTLGFDLPPRLQPVRDHDESTREHDESCVYLAPELWRPELTASPLGDVYALGVVAFECLAGRLPFDPAEAATLAATPWGAQPPSLPQSLADDVRWVVATATQPDPRRRFPYMGQFADALEDLTRLAGTDATPTVTLRRPALPPSPQPRDSLRPQDLGGSQELHPELHSRRTGTRWAALLIRPAWQRLQGRSLRKWLGSVLTMATIGLLLALGTLALYRATGQWPPTMHRMVLHLVDGDTRSGSTPAPLSGPAMAAEPVTAPTGPSFPVFVPDLTGRTLATAMAILHDQLHLQVQLQWRAQSGAGPNPTVTAQSLKGTTAYPGSVVVLTVLATPGWQGSSSPSPRAVPSTAPEVTSAPVPRGAQRPTVKPSRKASPRPSRTRTRVSILASPTATTDPAMRATRPSSRS